LLTKVYGKQGRKQLAYLAGTSGESAKKMEKLRYGGIRVKWYKIA